MERIRLSKNLIYGTYICLAVALLLCFILYMFPDDKKTMLPLVIFLPSSIAFAYIFSKAKTVDFDSDFMYISHGQITESIALSAVTVIKLTMIRINNEHIWKIKYKNAFGEINAVRVLPKHHKFEVFKKTVSTKNPDVQIKNFSTSFDFDI